MDCSLSIGIGCSHSPEFAFWQTIEFNADGKKWIFGSISKISQRNWATLKSHSDGQEIGILPQLTTLNNLHVGQEIKVTIEEKIHVIDISHV
jgi:hypothetical protein